MEGNLIECDVCGNPVSSTARVCPSCASLLRFSRADHPATSARPGLTRASSIALAWLWFLGFVTAGLGITGMIALRLA